MRRKNNDSIETLRVRALNACTLRGHNMRRFKAVESMDGRAHKTSECKACGAWVQVCASPAPNGIDISGTAVAVNCRGSHEEFAAEENKVRKLCGERLVDICACCKHVGFNIDHKLDGDPEPEKYYHLCRECCTLTYEQFQKRRRKFYGAQKA